MEPRPGAYLLPLHLREQGTEQNLTDTCGKHASVCLCVSACLFVSVCLYVCIGRGCVEANVFIPLPAHVYPQCGHRGLKEAGR